LGKEEWKYLPFIHPPHPSKHASTDNISSGLENSSDNIMETKGSFCIPLDLKLDLLWWNTFLPLYNGVSIMLSEEFSSPDEILSVDASMAKKYSTTTNLASDLEVCKTNLYPISL
jgi:hypothetical protein